ncbi:MAG: hypothetical protein H7Z14_08805 [Anaerolineae bacterium]|nr:hypothetical protein [Phycisphaerae bacterium]
MNHCLRKLSIALALLVGAGCVANQSQQTHAQTSQPTQATAPSSSVDAILDGLERRGQDLQSLRADVKLTETDPALGNEMARSGWFALQNQPDGSTRAHIVFDRKYVDQKTSSEKIEYLLDGGKLTDRNYARKKQATRTIMRPGEKMNLLKLGEGPFPLPIGQKRLDVLEQFDVQKIDPANDDPPGTVHLQLTPKERTPLSRKFKTIDTWVANDLPVRIKTLDRNESTERTTDLTNIQINSALKDADFELPKIDDKWSLTEETYQEPSNTPSSGR